MSRKIILATFFMTVLIGSLGLSFEVQRVEASGTIYIRTDGSIEPQDAPISSFDNFTYTLTGNINAGADGVVIERDNTVVNGSGYTLTGSGSGNGTRLTKRSNVTIGNMTIKNFEYGIFLDSSSNNALSGNNVTANNYCGIRLNYSSNSTVSGNSVSKNGGGIWLDYSSNNTLFGNNVTANNGGQCIWLGYSSDNTVSDNNISDNGGGISFLSSSDNTVSSNNVTNNGWSIGFGNSSGNILSGNNFADNGSGIELSYSSDSNVLSGNNVMVNEYEGIELSSSSENVLSGNKITANKGYGINLVSSSDNILSGNVMKDNRYNFGVTGYALSHYLLSIDTSNLVDDKPVYYFMNQSNIVVSADTYPDVGYLGFVNCANVTVQGLTLTGNVQGLLLAFTNDSKITGNYVANNWYGIRLDLPSNSNVLSGNTIANNDHGIYLYDSSDNAFYHNSFMNNTQPVHIENTGYANSWDNGYPSGGNYWSDYNGTDADHDGIGDTPYIIDADSIDHYPLMVPTVIPEFPLLLILALFFVATLLVVILYRRKILDSPLSYSQTVR